MSYGWQVLGEDMLKCCDPRSNNKVGADTRRLPGEGGGRNSPQPRGRRLLRCECSEQLFPLHEHQSDGTLVVLGEAKYIWKARSLCIDKASPVSMCVCVSPLYRHTFAVSVLLVPNTEHKPVVGSLFFLLAELIMFLFETPPPFPTEWCAPTGARVLCIRPVRQCANE